MKWSEKENKYLEEKYQNTETEKIAEKLNRSIDSVYEQASRLGLQKSPKYRSDTNSKNSKQGLTFKKIKIPKEDLAYIAGLFDGEGSITVYKRRGRYTFRKKRLIVNISNSNKEVLEWIKKEFGFGSVNKGTKTKNVTVFQYTTSGIYAKRLLYALFPYLKIKKETAKNKIGELNGF